MSGESPELRAARSVTAQTSAMLDHAPSFAQLHPAQRAAIVRDLSMIQQALNTDASGAVVPRHDPYALTLETPNDLARRRAEARRQPAQNPAGDEVSTDGGEAATPNPRVAATETLASRAGALSDEIDFPAFVAGLVHGTFDAIVDANIRQMEAFADLVSAVAKDVDQFTRENITPNQVRDWLVQRYPNDLALDMPTQGQPRLRRRMAAEEGEDEQTPAWLADFGLEGAELSDELIEGELVQAARRTVGEQRMQMLASMVLMGMSRINIKDGSISARVRFRAAARDKAAVDYATSHDPGGQTWGTRGGAAYNQHATMVSTVGVNVQADTDLKAELFGEVKINFASETVPLERFVDAAQMALLQRNSRAGRSASPAAPQTPPALPSPAELTLPLPTPPVNGGR